MSIPTTRLGRTGLEVSRLALGTMTFGLQTEEPVAREIMNKAASAGVNFIDVADVYPLGGGLATVGRTEEIVGRWLKGQRESFILATKAVGKMGPNAWNQGASRKHLLEAIDASLRRLQTDYVDLYQMHSDDASTPLDEALEALDAIVKSGKARYVGVSNFLSYRVAKALGRSELKGWARVVSLQPRYNLIFRQIERELLPLALGQGRSGLVVLQPAVQPRQDRAGQDGLAAAGMPYCRMAQNVRWMCWRCRNSPAAPVIAGSTAASSGSRPAGTW